MGSRKRPSGRPNGELASMMADLRAVYARIDAMLGQFSCPASTECCQFGRTGREPYLSRLEEEGLRPAFASLPKLRAEARGKGRSLAVVQADHCPFLRDDGQCRAYAMRPFGCRTFFCERREGEAKFPRREVNALAQELLQISLRHFPEHRHTRPLLRLFARRT